MDPGLAEGIDAFVTERTGDLVELVRRLVAFDTVSVDLSPGSEHTENEERGLQEVVAERLRRLGAEIDLFEPDAAALRDHPMMPPWHHWEGRPITVATLRGAGGGRSLIVNGHIDVVSPGDLGRWTTPPFAADVRDGRIYGRGAVDMKGGVAAAMFALEALAANGVELAGDVIVQAVPDEETCAMGTVAVIERGYRADAGLVPEPTRLGFWIATRGLLHGSVSVPGRSAHAEMNQPPWQRGGGVNAIERSVPVLKAFQALSADWATRDSKAHPLLGRPCVQPTIIRGGVFISNVPESCEIDLNATYLPRDADEDGYGSVPRGGDPARGRGRGRARRLARGHAARLDVGDGLPALGDRPRRGHHRRHPGGRGRDRGRRARRGHRHDLRRRAADPARRRAQPGLRPRRPRARPRAGRVDRHRRARAGRPRLRPGDLRVVRGQMSAANTP